jgi:hypothetical protein
MIVLGLERRIVGAKPFAGWDGGMEKPPQAFEIAQIGDGDMHL